MKETIELPEALLERTRVAAARRQVSVQDLVIEGLEAVLREEGVKPSAASALARLRKGYDLGGEPLSRDDAHAR